jgi:hypothetical protein
MSAPHHGQGAAIAIATVRNREARERKKAAEQGDIVEEDEVACPVMETSAIFAKE